ncbi:alpha/beta-hydrolase [Trichoderma cornu-damae]|uniref:Alpha/beta-hydrolase n=1 Tax=Trichoderma cornu-damae TaxID=654480 RepID=A0A9P8QP46_9HYPO|nr:alpha/beta-hydrolase [Trichoderma cornu-damae]
MGLFNEMGACWLEPGADATVPNEFAWNSNASVLFEEVFPDRAHLPIHIAAESYGGHYAPVYLDHILESRRLRSRDAFWGKISSLMLVDAVIDVAAPAVGAYEFLCKGFGHHGKIINDTACEALRLSVPKILELGRDCDAGDDGYGCYGLEAYLEEEVHPYFYEEVEAGKRNPFNAHVEKALDLPYSFVFEDVDLALNSAYTRSKDSFRPTSRELARVLDAHRTSNLGDIRALVLQGNEDYIVNTPGNMWAYDNLRWSGLADYRLAPWRELPERMAATGLWKSSGRLAFVAVDGAGHTVPGDVRDGSYRIAQEWFQGGWRA